VSVKKAKAKGKGKGAAKKSAAKKPAAKNSAAKKKKGKDIAQVRENINELVKASAKLIANKVIEVAKTGQLASARYLFEAVGLYPPTEQTAAPPVKDTLAHTLLTRMGLPTDPVICEEDETQAELAKDGKGVQAEITTPSAGDEPGAEVEDEREPDPSDTVQ
jgi:hypothetical protein